MRLSPSTKLRREQRKPFKVGWRVLALVRPSVALPCWRCSSPWIYRPHYNADRRVAGGPKPWRLALHRVGGRVDRGVENQEPCVHNQKKRGVMTTSSILPRISMHIRWEEPHRADTAGHFINHVSVVRVQTMPSSIGEFLANEALIRFFRRSPPSGTGCAGSDDALTGCAVGRPTA